MLKLKNGCSGCTGNTIIGAVANNAHIHLNGYLNYVVDNHVAINETHPGGISTSSSLKMYNSYALSNRVLANSAGALFFQGDGGCDNFAAGNAVDVTVATSAPASRNDWFRTALPNATQDCIAGVDTKLPVAFGYQ
jgi:hypothetical protein